MVTLDRVRDILKNQIPIAVRKGDFQIGLHVKSTTPCHEVQPGRVDRGGERGEARIGVRGREGVPGTEPFTPVQGLYLLVFINSEHVGHVSGVDPKDPCPVIKMN